MKYPVELKEVFFAKGKTLFPIKGQHRLVKALSSELEQIRRPVSAKKNVHQLKVALKKKKNK